MVSGSPARKRRLTRAILVAVSLPPLACLILLAIVWRDERPHDTSDLRLAHVSLPDEENAFSLLANTANRVDRSPWANERKPFDDMARGLGWDDEKAERWLAPNKELWTEVSQAIVPPRGRAPLLQKSSQLSDFSQTSFNQLELLKLSSLRSQQLHHGGRHDDAFAWMAVSLRAAHRIESAQGRIAEWLAGVAANTVVRSGLEHLILSGYPSAESAAMLHTVLEETRPTAESLADVIRCEHEGVSVVLAEIRQFSGSSGLGEEFDSMLATTRWLPPLLKPNRTGRLQAEYFRAFIPLVKSDWGTLKSRAPETEMLFGDVWPRSNPDNLVGRALLQVTLPSLHTFLTLRIKIQSSISITQTAIALRRYEILHGDLPSTLSDLVPDHFAAVPIDYYDGEAIRYSRELRAVWSIGQEGTVVTDAESLATPSVIHLKIPSRDAVPRR